MGSSNPLEQFEIKRLIDIRIGGVDASFTNSSLFMVIALLLTTIFILYAMRKRALVPGRFQLLAELTYEFIASMVRDNVGEAGMPYFPFVFTLFMFILFANLLGMVPFSFTVTSHIIVTFALAIVVCGGVTVIGFVRHGWRFMGLFAPKGVPLVLLVILVPIEIISYLVRPFSLSIRLFANMMAGHTLMKVFASFVISLGLLAGWIPILLISAMSGLEVGIALLQAYVFVILTCLYLNDGVNMHH